MSTADVFSDFEARVRFHSQLARATKEAAAVSELTRYVEERLRAGESVGKVAARLEAAGMSKEASSALLKTVVKGLWSGAKWTAKAPFKATYAVGKGAVARAKPLLSQVGRSQRWKDVKDMAPWWNPFTLKGFGATVAAPAAIGAIGPQSLGQSTAHVLGVRGTAFRPGIARVRGW